MGETRPSESDDVTVLIVEDDAGVADVFRRWLSPEYTVQIASSGTEALERIDRDTIDVVLLDRVMPGLSGDDILERIRSRDGEIMVAVVSAVEPDFDVLSMGFDDYVTKPSSKKELRSTVDDLLERRRHTDQRREYHSLLAKKAALEEQKSAEVLRESEEYTTLIDRIDTLSETLDAVDRDLLDDVEFVSAIKQIDSENDTDRLSDQ